MDLFQTLPMPSVDYKCTLQPEVATYLAHLSVFGRHLSAYFIYFHLTKPDNLNPKQYWTI